MTDTHTSPEGQDQFIEADIRKASVIAVGLIGALTAALLALQVVFNLQLAELQDAAVAPSAAVAQLETAVSALHARQTKVALTTSSADLAAVPSRAPLEQRFSSSLAAIGTLKPEHDAKLQQVAQSFLQVDTSLFASAQQQHQLREQFAVQQSAVEAELRALVESANGIAGTSRLNTVLLLRRLRDNLGSRPLGREVVFGNGRAQQEAVSQVVTSVLQLGVLVGKVGMAPHNDALNGVQANALPQNQAAAMAAFSAWRDVVDDPTVLARLQTLQAQWTKVQGQVSDPSSSTSLVSLRRQMLRQQQNAVQVAQAEAKTNAALNGLLANIEADVAAAVTSTKQEVKAVSWASRVALAVLFVVGVLALRSSRRRVNTSVVGLRKQNEELTSLRDSLRDINANLEEQVAQRTADLVAREASMRLILDSTGDGLAYIDAQGEVGAEISASMARWFGHVDDGQSVGAYLHADDNDAANTDLSFEQITDGFLPAELAADQMPNRMEHEGAVLRLSWTPIFKEDDASQLDGVLLVVSDQTAAEESERAQRQAGELQTSVRHILQDRQGFLSFLDNAEALLQDVIEGDRTTAMRALHTVKGNSAIMGFGDVARCAHHIEDHLTERGEGGVNEAEAAELRDTWAASRARVADFLDVDSAISLSESDFTALRQAIVETLPHDVLRQKLDRLKHVPTSKYLRRLAEQAEAVGERLGRPVQVDIEADDTRAPKSASAFFSSLVHVIRNAIDHGIEPKEQRKQNGKSESGNLRLCSHAADDGTLWIELHDDGAGIDWSKLRARAEAQGLSASNDADLLFADGLSTRDEVSELSGRGVGLAAVRSTVDELHGSIDVVSEPGKGTVFRFSFPKLAS